MSSIYSVIPNLPRPTSDPRTPFLVAAAGLTELRAPDLNNSLIHLYRGELGRQIAYRQRLDTSTQYAVTIASTLTVLSFAYSSVPSYVHLLIAFFVCIFLMLETRRYLYYQVIKHRVTQLEKGYYGKYILGPKWQQQQQPSPAPPPTSTPPTPDLVTTNGHSHSNPTKPSLIPPLSTSSSSATLTPTPSSSPHTRRHSVTIAIPNDDDNPNLFLPSLLHSLLHPTITMTSFQAMCIRLQRVYWGLLMGVYIGWIMKVQYVDDWKTQVYPIVVFAVVMIALTVWVYWLFPLTRQMRSWQRWYWTDERFHSLENEVDV